MAVNAVEGRKTIYEPLLDPGTNGISVPAGELPPVSETINAFPAYSGEAIIHYGTEPNGETLASKVISSNVVVLGITPKQEYETPSDYPVRNPYAG
ncbi:MAG: hypothetical protein ACREGA_03725 [Candidatus Saccharimonadales bacterium]